MAVASRPCLRDRQRPRTGSGGQHVSANEFRCASRGAILAAVDPGHLAVEDRLTRIRGLLKGLPGPLGNGEMLVWVNPGDVDSMPQEVLALIVGAADHLKRWNPGGSEDDIPRDAADLMTKLTEVDEAKGTETLVWLLSSTMAYRVGGRYEEAKARDVAKAMARLLGYGTRWWTNTDLGDYPSVWPYNPVTQHTMSAVVVSVGNGVIVTILAVDED
jgi:hypothetical protein